MDDTSVDSEADDDDSTYHETHSNGEENNEEEDERDGDETNRMGEEEGGSEGLNEGGDVGGNDGGVNNDDNGGDNDEGNEGGDGDTNEGGDDEANEGGDIGGANEAGRDDDNDDDTETIDIFPPEPGADRDGYVETEADRLLNTIYGDHAHENDGCHLDGGIGPSEDAKWMRYWRRVVQTKPIWYKNPQGRLGKQFIRKLAELFRGVRERKWNSEMIIVFPAVILYKADGVTAARDIRAKIESRLTLWNEGRYSALINDMEVEASMRGGNGRAKTEEETDRDFNAKVLSGHLRSAVRTLTQRGGGKVLSPDDTCSKAGIPVLEVLRSKHPNLREPTDIGEDGGAFEPYALKPTTIPLIVSSDTVEEVVVKMGGSAGPGGPDSVALKAWCLGFGHTSGELRSEIARFTTWIANTNPSWAAYRALMACRLVALDKEPGTRPLGIGETYRRLMAKCVLKCVGDRATSACGNYNLCVGLKAGIEGAVHALREAEKDAQDAVDRAKVQDESDTEDDNDDDSDSMTDDRRVHWEDEAGEASSNRNDSVSSEEPDWPVKYDPQNPHGTACIDARNGFNELNRKAMLWTVRHLWAAGARFAFNCYRHSAQLVLRRDGNECNILQSREGVTQGDPLSMVLYGLALVPLAKFLRASVPSVIQPWYADDCAMSGKVEDIATAMRLLLRHGPPRGYYPEPSKSILVCRTGDRPRARRVLEEFNFLHREGTRYIGGFIGTQEARDEWLEPKLETWKLGIKSLARAAKRYPQTAYAGLTQSLQSEWTYLQRVVPNIADSFTPIERAIATEFLPALFEGEPPERRITQLPVRMAGLGILDPELNCNRHYMVSVAMTQAVSDSLRKGEDLDAIGYGKDSTQILRDHRSLLDVDNEQLLAPILEEASKKDERRMNRTRWTGAWLTATPSADYGTALTCTEFRDALRIRNGMIPNGLPTFCDGCNTARFTVGHAFQCKQGGLVRARHEELAGEWHQLCAQALTPSSVSDEPTISQYQNEDDGENNRVPELRGDVSAHGFWTRGTTAIFDIRVTDTDAASYKNTDPTTVLKRQEREKKDKYAEACRQAHMHFTPLVFSVDGLEGGEATAARKRLASRLAAKWKRQYSQVCGFVRCRLSFTLIRSASRCLRGTRNHIQRPQSIDWAQNAGMRLYTQLF